MEADRDGGPDRLGGLVDALVAGVSGHLPHEEEEALPLIDATMSLEQWQWQWQCSGRSHGRRIGVAEAPRYLPRLLDGTDEGTGGRVRCGGPDYRDHRRANVGRDREPRAR